MIIGKDITLQPWKIIVHSVEELEEIAPQLAKYGYKVRGYMYSYIKRSPIVLYANAKFCIGKGLEYNNYPDPKTVRYNLPIYGGPRIKYNTKGKILHMSRG